MSCGNNVDVFDGILTLNNRHRNAERIAYNRGAGSGFGGSGRGPGRPPTTDIPLEELLACEEPEAKAARTRRRGATFALTTIGTRPFIGSRSNYALLNLSNVHTHTVDFSTLGFTKCRCDLN